MSGREKTQISIFYLPWCWSQTEPPPSPSIVSSSLTIFLISCKSLDMEPSCRVCSENNQSHDCSIWRVISPWVIGFFFMWTGLLLSLCCFEHTGKFPLVFIFLFICLFVAAWTCQGSKCLSKLCAHVIYLSCWGGSMYHLQSSCRHGVRSAHSSAIKHLLFLFKMQLRTL